MSWHRDNVIEERMDPCSPSALFIWFTHACKVVFDYILVVMAQMFRTSINYWLQQICFDRIIFILMKALVNVSPCQKPTEYQTNCFTVLDFVKRPWMTPSLPIVTSHPLTHGGELVSRIPVRSEDQLLNWNQNVIMYEKYVTSFKKSKSHGGTFRIDTVVVHLCLIT